MYMLIPMKNALYTRLGGGSKPRRCTTQDSEPNAPCTTEWPSPVPVCSLIYVPHKLSQTTTITLRGYMFEKIVCDVDALEAVEINI